jgi:HPt (histidine-containing phosphotransfer) domain-containing protein
MASSLQLDPAALDRLRRYGGPEMVGELIALYRQETPGRLARAQEALTAGKLTDFADAMHGLRSSTGNLGAREIEALVHDLERRARLRQREQLAADLERLHGLVADLFATLDREGSPTV